MYYIVETDKSFGQAASDLETAVRDHNFGVLHVHDLGEKLREKGIDYTGECRVFEICSPPQAAKVLAVDLKLNMALPCRISVYTEHGRSRIGFIKPVKILSGLSDDPALMEIAREVESEMIAMADQAA